MELGIIARLPFLSFDEHSKEKSPGFLSEYHFNTVDNPINLKGIGDKIIEKIIAGTTIGN